MATPALAPRPGSTEGGKAPPGVFPPADRYFPAPEAAAPTGIDTPVATHEIAKGTVSRS
jgi:hypothetical protein